MRRRPPNRPRLASRDPFKELERLRRQMDRLFEGLSDRLSSEPDAGVFPRVNVTEGNDDYYVRAELPGVRSGDIGISVTGTSLSISGERKRPPEDEKANYHRREREAGKFSRVIDLPGQIDTSRVEARCMDGVLRITLPKAEAVSPRKITVKVK